MILTSVMADCKRARATAAPVKTAAQAGSGESRSLLAHCTSSQKGHDLPCSQMGTRKHFHRWKCV